MPAPSGSEFFNWYGQTTHAHPEPNSANLSTSPQMTLSPRGPARVRLRHFGINHSDKLLLA